MLKRISAFITAALVFVLSFGTVYADNTAQENAVPASSEQQEEGYTPVASDSGITLYADMETGYFYIENSADKTRVYSVPRDMKSDTVTTGITKMLINSQIRLQYMANDKGVFIGNETITPSSQGSLFKNGVKVKQIKNGIRVEYTFPAVEAMIPVEYTLNNGAFEAAIITEDITEKKSFVITAIELLPMFGAANSTASGSLFVPDGYGALIDFNKGAQNNIYKSPIYGEELSVRRDMEKTQTEKIRMPVFATLGEEGTLIGIITNGDASASVMAIAANSSCGYNAVSSILNYRTLAYDTMLSNNANTEQSITRASKKYSLPEYRVRYYWLTGEKSGYVGAAEKYRDYLMNEKGLKQQGSEPKFNIDVYGAAESRGNFLGISYRKALALTTYKDTLKIIDTAKKNGIDDISLRLIGWGKDGIQNNSPLTAVKFSSVLGGKSEYLKLKKTVDKEEIPLIMDADLISFRKAGKKYKANTLFNKIAYQYTYLRSVYAIDLRYSATALLAPALLGQNSDKLINSLEKANISDVSLSGITNMLYSDFNNKRAVAKVLAADKVTEALKSFKKADMKISGEAANAYTLPYLSKIYAAPQSTSAYKLFDREIPFYQIVLHGIIPITSEPIQSSADYKQSLLKSVETGSELLYNAIYESSDKLVQTAAEDLYAAHYKNWISQAAQFYKDYYDLLKKIYNQTIVSHTEIMPDVMKTVYSDGTAVIVNYNEEDVTVDGTIVKAEAFCEIKV